MVCPYKVVVALISLAVAAAIAYSVNNPVCCLKSPFFSD
jgi:hypothetical protein